MTEIIMIVDKVLTRYIYVYVLLRYKFKITTCIAMRNVQKDDFQTNNDYYYLSKIIPKF